MELDQIRVKEKRLLDAKVWLKPGSEETRQCDIGLEALRQQREVLWAHLHNQATEQGRQLQSEGRGLQSERGEKPSAIEIMMETDEIDTEMDMTIVEQGILLKPAQTIEANIYSRLVKYEANDIQWRFEARAYLITILEVNKQARASGDDT